MVISYSPRIYYTTVSLFQTAQQCNSPCLGLCHESLWLVLLTHRAVFRWLMKVKCVLLGFILRTIHINITTKTTKMLFIKNLVLRSLIVLMMIMMLRAGLWHMCFIHLVVGRLTQLLYMRDATLLFEGYDRGAIRSRCIHTVSDSFRSC